MVKRKVTDEPQDPAERRASRKTDTELDVLAAGGAGTDPATDVLAAGRDDTRDGR